MLARMRHATPAPPPGAADHQPPPSAACDAEPALDDDSCPPQLDEAAEPPVEVDAVLRAQVPAAADGERLDKVLAALFPQFSRSRLKMWCEAGQVSAAGAPLAPRTKARAGAEIELRVPVDAEASSFIAEPVPLRVLWHDDTVAVIDKPAGLVVHPAAGNWSGTLLNGLLARFPSCAALPRAGIVHRLDKDTSGLLVVALSLTAQTDLVRQLQARSVSRQYLALAWGELGAARSVDAPIGRHPRDRLRMAVVASGKPARTHFEPLATLSTPAGAVTALRCRLDTGRTHQIRVHAQHLGLPLVGDALYGRRGAPQRDAPWNTLARQALHAAVLSFDHPRDARRLSFVAPVADDVRALWLALGGDAAVLAVDAWSRA
jgi:23S rRNA pseudouridine1911/1915/1917 synthase